MNENNTILLRYYKTQERKEEEKTKKYLGKGWFCRLKSEDRPPSVAGGIVTGFYVA
jgi:hypothetical protein